MMKMIDSKISTVIDELKSAEEKGQRGAVLLMQIGSDAKAIKRVVSDITKV